MAQPDYVPLQGQQRVRPAEPMPPAKPWTATRPGEMVGLRPPVGPAFGSPGPDQGYALTLAARFVDRLLLAEGEHPADAVAGCVPVALKRASLLGRAPVVYDLELAFMLFGFLGDAPKELVAFRHEWFAGAAHAYWKQRAIADLVPESTLRLTPPIIHQRLSEWRSLFDAAAVAS